MFSMRASRRRPLAAGASVAILFFFGGSASAATDQLAPAAPAVGMSPAPGQWTALILDVDYVDAPGSGFDPVELEAAWLLVGDFWNENSYGLVTLTPTVTTVIRMPETRAHYVEGLNTGDVTLLEIMADALQAAAATGYRIESYDFHVLMNDLRPGGVGAPGHKAFAAHTGFGLTAMEITHSLDTKHSNAWRTFDRSVIGPGEVIEYGNPFDVMGTATYGPRSHLTVRLKHKLGWLPDSSVLTVTESGVYRIQAHDRPLAGWPAALRIKRDEDTNYWVEFRDLLTENVWTSNGALIGWGYNDWQYWGDLEVQQSLLLDMTPGSEGGFRDAALTIGHGFDDAGAGIHIRVLGKGGTTPQTLDVEVILDGTPGPIDDPCVVAILEPPNTTTIYAGMVTFEATAHDPDVGTQNGEGIAEVEFQLFGGGGEEPIAVSGPLTTPPYLWTFDTAVFANSGYSLVVRGTSTQAAGGHFNSTGTFLMVSNPDPSGVADRPRGTRAARDALALRVRPNPGSGPRSISFAMSRAGTASLRIVDVGGRVVATLPERFLERGEHVISLSDRSVGPELDTALPAGVYIVELTAAGTRAFEKLVVLE